MELTTRRIPFPRPLRIGAAAVALATAAATVLLTDRTEPPWVLPVVLAVCLLVAVVGTSSVHWLTVGDRDVVVHHRPLARRRIPLADVARVEVIERASPRAYGGYGVRVARGGVVAFINRPGPAVRIEQASGRTTVVVLDSAEEAQRVRRRLDPAAAGDRVG